VLKLLAFVLPLGLDSFAMAALLGAAGVTRAQRARISVLFVTVEAGMPLAGLAVGAPLAAVIGSTADYSAAAALILLGAWMLRENEQTEEAKAQRLLRAHGIALLGLGVSISLDELAIGFSLGLTGLPILPVIIAIGVQTLIVVQLGLALGARIGERWREHTERIASLALIGLGVYLLINRIARH
jgi:putative Mn2+ efflux pump MntP